MQIFLVGGAVRDKLLKLPVRDRDWVVVGSTPAEMERRGFTRLNTNFPVFLHPHTGEEYALARTETKSASGHQGFIIHASPETTLEEDLQRRDLTINAIAEDADGTLIDPLNGQHDLVSKCLRHISPAFTEDPLRVLRVARFAARLAPRGFRLAPETLDLMRSMSKNGELSSLSRERIWQETRRALEEPAATVYFQLLHQCCALKIVLPELSRSPAWADGGQDILNSLEHAQEITPKTSIRFAVLVSAIALDKNTTEADHICSQLRVPTRYRELAGLVATSYPLIENRPQAGKLLALLEKLDAFRRSSRFRDFLIATTALAATQSGGKTKGVATLEQAFRKASQIRRPQARDEQENNIKLSELFRQQRKEAIEQLLIHP